MSVVDRDRAVSPEYFDLRGLARYSSCSVRWLRERLVASTAPLPHYRIKGKLLVKREEFDQWMAGFRTRPTPNQLDTIVEGVVQDLLGKRAS